MGLDTQGAGLVRRTLGSTVTRPLLRQVDKGRRTSVARLGEGARAAEPDSARRMVQLRRATDDAIRTKGLTGRRVLPAHLGCDGPRRVARGVLWNRITVTADAKDIGAFNASPTPWTRAGRRGNERRGKRKHPYSTVVAGKAAVAHRDVAVVTILKSNNAGVIRSPGEGAAVSAAARGSFVSCQAQMAGNIARVVAALLLSGGFSISQVMATRRFRSRARRSNAR